MRRVVLVCLLVAVSEACLAQSPYDLESKREWFLLGTGAALGIASFVLIENAEALTIEEISRLDPSDINSFDRKAIEPYRDTNAGDALMYASYLLPFTFLAYPDTKHDWRTLGVMWAEVTLINLGLNGVVKGLALRTRPYAYDPDTPLEKKTSVDARFSFYSGHISSATANCFFVAKVFNDYLTDKRAKALIWTGAALYPALTGYLRRDSGHHFRTDVITGCCMGALVGYFVPRLHRNRGANELSLYPTTVFGTAGLGLRFAF